MNTQTTILPISVNLHFWRPCNMRCGFCFATYEDTVEQLPRGHLPRESLLKLIGLLADHGAKKLTFVGGEPTLCPWLGELITHAKHRGMTTMMVSNGWRLRDGDYMRSELRDLDWLTLSVDSINAEHNVRSGRAHRGNQTMSAEDLLLIGARAAEQGMRLKLNTVVHAHNVDEDLGSFVADLKPLRWKLFQVLPVGGQNDARIDEFSIDAAGFSAYVQRHMWLEQLGVKLVPEDNTDMRGTYAMIDPCGRFFDTVEKRHRYSEPILTVGVEQAWASVSFSDARFVERGGVYEFDAPLIPLRVRDRSDTSDD